MARVSVGNVEINYEVDGDGPWLTMLHGFSQNLSIWNPHVERLAGSFRMLRIDLRGHGGSSAPSGGYGVVEYATDVLAVLDRLGIGTTHLWGTHTGAGVGLLLATQHPDRLAMLVLDGAVIPGHPQPAVDEWLARAREIALRDGVPAARQFWFEQTPFFSGFDRDTEHRAIIDTFTGAPWLATEPSLPIPDIRASLSGIRHHTLIINGAKDLPEFLDRAELLERELPHARRYLVPGAGPFPFWEAPNAVGPLVAQFLDDA